MSVDASAVFERELERRGLSFERLGEDTYRILGLGRTLEASLANVRRDAERDGDAEALVRFVDHVLALADERVPPWSEAARLLLFSAEAADHDFGETIHDAVSDEVARVLTLTDAEHSRVTWVTRAMCAAWGVSVEQALEAAADNQDRLLDGVELELAESGGHTLAMVPLEPPYKASAIFARAFRRLVTPALGWPVLVVIPCRDFLYVVADQSPLLGRMGSVVVREYLESGYPITTEVLRVADDGIRAIGKYPVQPAP